LTALGIEAATVVMPPGESTKSLDQASRLYDELVSGHADRHTLIVALGGGVIGDLAGFVAATFARGLPLIMVPTTLLAQVDSSVGGKVGINHPAAKNSIGAFHQPAGVWIDTETLRTLPARELRAGLAEVVKYGVILDSEFFAGLERDVDLILAQDGQALRRIIVESCRKKAAVVSEDEREETGLRAILNFGHTIGHAIEAVAGYDGPFQHGEAVAVGMAAEARLAERLGWIGADAVDRLTRLLERFGLPTSAPGLDAGKLMAAMARDKKNRAGKIRFVLPRSIGKVELTDTASHDDVRAVLSTL
jgi:3-dehydroquinate synthase